MPYTIKTVGEEFCVYKEGAEGQPTGETLGCHPTHDKAATQIGAIMASEEAKAKEAVAPAEDSGEGYCVCLECGYKAVHAQGEPCVDKFCPKCSAKLSNEEAEEETIEVTGNAKERHLFHSIVAYVAKALGITLKPNDGEERERIQAILDQVGEKPAAFFTLREKAGSYRWVAISGSNHQDRTTEIISQRALEIDVKANPTDRGELVYWHERTVPLGSCDFGLVSDGFLIESGLWYDSVEARAFREATQRSPEEWKMSIGFITALRAVERRQRVRGRFVPAIHNLIVIEERSLLPASQAANLFTTLVQDEKERNMRADKKEKLAQVVGPALADALEARIAAAQEEAEATQTASRDTPLTVQAVAAYLRELGQEEYATLLEGLRIAEPTAEEREAAALETVREFLEGMEDSSVKSSLLEALTPAAPEQQREEPTPVTNVTNVTTPPIEGGDVLATLTALREEVATLAAKLAEKPAQPPADTTRAALLRPSQREGNIDEAAPKVAPPPVAAGEAVVGSMSDTLFDRILGNRDGGN